MVDFSSDSTISKAPIEIVNLIVIEHWYNWRLAWEFYIKQKLNNSKPSLAECRARLSSLYLSSIEMLKRKLDPETFKDLNILCCDFTIAADHNEILEGYIIINGVLDSAGLVKLDTKPYINRQKIEEANRANGY